MSVSLHHRIFWPFATVAVLATAVSAWIALAVATRALQTRVETQVVNAASLVARSDFALNETILRSVQTMTGADIVTFAADGTILATTIDPARRPLAATIVAGARTQPGADDGGARHLSCLDAPCVVAVRPLTTQPGVRVAVAAVTSDVIEATRVVTRTILAAALLSALLMVVATQIVARRVTAPLEALVAFASRVSTDAGAGRAPVGQDEVGRLGAAFNAMLDRLDESRSALVRSEKLSLAGLIAARVAHEIRNPLNSIKMLAQLLRAKLESAGDPSLPATAEAIARNTAHIDAVVRDLLEVARPGELVRRPTRMNDVVADVLAQLAPQLAHRKVAIETRLDPAAPEALLDGQRLRQVLVNIINNASDAMPAGGALTIATAWDRPSSTLALTVCDDGVGLDPGVRHRLFDPFVTTKPDGVGLGLVNARSVIESHGGTIALAPRAPRGTQVAIALPIRAEAHG